MLSSSLRSRCSAVVLGVAAALIALELALQVGAVVVWWNADRGPAVAGDTGARTVLCVGDSFTFGIGATAQERSYPGELGRVLGPSWRVVQGGWPGRDSRELLAALGAQLERHRPAVVCVLVGVNDRWTRPAPLPAGTETDAAVAGFPWRCRTCRLAAMLWSAIRADAEAAPQAPPLEGAWFLLGERVEFRADGGGSFGAEPLRWQSRNELVEVEIPGAFHTVATWTDAGGKLILTGVGNGEQIALERLDAMCAERVPAAWRAVETGQPQFADDLLAPLLRLTRDDDPWAIDLRRAAHAIAVAGGGATAEQHARWLADRGASLAFERPELGPRVEPDDAVGAVLAEHLQRVVARCRAAGAEPVLLSYPHDWPIRSVHRDVAAATGAIFVDPVSRFAELRAVDRAVELLVADGHCNDRGYAELAGLVAPAVVAAAGRR